MQGLKYYGEINYNIPRKKVNSTAIVLTLIRIPLQNNEEQYKHFVKLTSM